MASVQPALTARAFRELKAELGTAYSRINPDKLAEKGWTRYDLDLSHSYYESIPGTKIGASDEIVFVMLRPSDPNGKLVLQHHPKVKMFESEGGEYYLQGSEALIQQALSFVPYMTSQLSSKDTVIEVKIFDKHGEHENTQFLFHEEEVGFVYEIHHQSSGTVQIFDYYFLEPTLHLHHFERAGFSFTKQDEEILDLADESRSQALLGVNRAPSAVDDTIPTNEETAIMIDVLANDTDPDGDALRITGTSTATNGTVQIVDNKIVYTPIKDFVGQDTFTYTITDDNGGTDTATVTVVVNNVNDVPDAVDDAVSTNEETAITIDVLANDTDPDGDALRITGTSTATNGTVQIVDNKIVYTPIKDFVGQDTFTYTITDDNGGTDTATVTVVVNNVNDAPDAVDDTFSTNEETAITLDVLANDTDPDGDALRITGTSTATNGTVQIVNNKIVYTPIKDFVGQDTFTYTITDDNGGTDTATVTVVVNNVNDAPDAVDDTFSTREETAITIDVLANDTDPDGDALRITGTSTATNGTVQIVDNKIVYTPIKDFVGQDTFTYTITDDNGGTDTATVTVVVNNVNDAPDAVDDTFSTNEETAITLDVLANDTDPDGDALRITGTSTATNGTVQIVNNKIVYTPIKDFVGQDTFTYTITDDNGGTDTATVTVVVNNVNDAPDAVDDTFSTK